MPSGEPVQRLAAMAAEEAAIPDAELEEGEIEGEIANEVAGEASAEAAEEGDLRGDRILAPDATGRAPFFATPGEGGWDSSAGKRQRKKNKGRKSDGFVDVYGDGAVASAKVHPGEGPIRIADVQNLVLWVLGEGCNPRWCFLQNKLLIKRVVLLAVHGLSRALYEEKKELLGAWEERLGQPVAMQARSATLHPAQTTHSLFTVPLPQSKKRQREAQQQAQQAQQAAAEGQADGRAEPQGGGGEGTGQEDAGAGAAEATPGAPQAKRMKLSRDDDVSSHAQPQLPPAPQKSPPAEQQQQQQQQGGEASSSAGGARSAAAAAAGPSGRRGSGRPPPLPASHYVMSLEEMERNSYPLPALDPATGELRCPEGYAATRPALGGAPVHAMVAVDCEMCVTEEGFELTRATVLGSEGQILLDELVLPTNPITDYNTQYSGITAAMLEGVTVRLADVRERILALVAAETILVAHGGENDLRALRLIHANVMDTGLLFPHPRGPPYKSALRVLASRFLHRSIQTGSHNPVEDAKAALDLAALKIARGPAFGTQTGERGERLTEVLGRHERRSALVDRLEVLNRHVSGNCSAIVAEGDADVAAKLAKEAARPGVDFAWGQLLGLHAAYDQRVTKLQEAGVAEPSEIHASAALAEPVDAALRALGEQVAAVHAALPPGTLLVVASGQGDTPYGKHLLGQKYRRQQGLDGLPPWSVECEAHLASVNSAAADALCWATVKQA